MYQYWIWIVFSILFGGGLGWRFVVQEPGDLVLSAARSVLFGGAFWYLFLRRRTSQTARKANSYFHPILGLWAGIAGSVAAVAADTTVIRALVVGIIVGLLWAEVTVIARWLETRNDPPGTRRPIPTITGWREQSSRH